MIRNLSKQAYLNTNSFMFSNKYVLDLACHNGVSTKIIKSHNPTHIYGIDIRQHLVEQAIKEIGSDSVELFVGDITDLTLLEPLVQKSNVVTFFGALYHLFDHFRFFSYIMQPHIEYILIETLFGPETINPEMFWGYEPTDIDTNGWLRGCSVIPNGTPNLSWIIQSANIFGFNCDWVQTYYTGSLESFQAYKSKIKKEDYNAVADASWPSYEMFVSQQNIPDYILRELEQSLPVIDEVQKRMVLRLYNTKLIQSVPLQIKDLYIWK